MIPNQETDLFGIDVVPITNPPICTVVDFNNSWYVPIEPVEKTTCSPLLPKRQWWIKQCNLKTPDGRFNFFATLVSVFTITGCMLIKYYSLMF